MKNWRYPRPKFQGRAAFKTFLRRRGFLVRREFYGQQCCIAERKGRLYRFRFDAGEVDISCPRHEFDRWANSRERTLDLEQFKRWEKCDVY